MALFVLAMLAIFGLVRGWSICRWDHENYSTRSEQNRIQLQPIGPPRGLIFDRNGVLLGEQPAGVRARTSSRERVTT